MVIHLRILSWALIFILQLHFPPRKSIAEINIIIVPRSSSIDWLVLSSYCQVMQGYVLLWITFLKEIRWFGL